MSILDVFCSVDEFWREFAPAWTRQLVGTRQRRRQRTTHLHPSEIMTILIWFHQSRYRTFKAYYTEYVQVHLRGEFPQLVSYQRFVELTPSVLVPLIVYLHTQLGSGTGISFVDSTALAVCHPARIPSTASLRPPPDGARRRRAGSTASSCIWWSMTGASCSPSR